MWVEQGARWGAEHTKSRPMVADDSAATRTRDDDSTCTCLGLHLVDILFGSAGDLEGGCENIERARVLWLFHLARRACVGGDDAIPRKRARVLGAVQLQSASARGFEHGTRVSSKAVPRATHEAARWRGRSSGTSRVWSPAGAGGEVARGSSTDLESSLLHCARARNHMLKEKSGCPDPPLGASQCDALSASTTLGGAE